MLGLTQLYDICLIGAPYLLISFIDNFSLSARQLDFVIMLPHGILLLIGFALFPAKRVPYVTGGIAAILCLLLVMFIADGGPGGTSGTTGAWYLIFSVATAGIVPVITLTSSFWSGRFFRALIR